MTAKDLFINQANLTDESMPVEKTSQLPMLPTRNPLELPNLCFMGSNIESGTGNAVVLQTGSQTFPCAEAD